jgi:hypothetical protein
VVDELPVDFPIDAPGAAKLLPPPAGTALGVLRKPALFDPDVEEAERRAEELPENPADCVARQKLEAARRDDSIERARRQ